MISNKNVSLFPLLLKTIDFETDKKFSKYISSIYKKYPDGGAGKNLLNISHPVIKKIKKRFDLGMKSYLNDIGYKGNKKIECFMFLNYFENETSFTPSHNHIGAADFVAIYYVECRNNYIGEFSNNTPSYYYPEDEILLLHNPIRESSDEYFIIYPRKDRLVIHPAGINHTVTPSYKPSLRISITCEYIVDKYHEDYKSYSFTI